ncbi:MAG: DUF371 domain-containing protein [Sulfolobaceae archaeon]|nr:DUF371 domain-containing protein [Sulfolobaceae archaeon]
MIKVDVIRAKGHQNVRALHKTTLEVTREDFLTPRGDCIIGVSSDKGAKDLDEGLKELIKKDNTYVYLLIVVDNLYQLIKARGSSKLTLTNDTKIILRKSDYISDATIGIRANASAKDIDRNIIKLLKDPNKDLYVFILASDLPLKDEEVLRIVINSYPISLSLNNI